MHELGLGFNVFSDDALELTPRPYLIAKKMVRITDHSLAHEPIGWRHGNGRKLLGQCKRLSLFQPPTDR